MSIDPENWTVSQTMTQLKKRDSTINDDALMTLKEHEVDMRAMFDTNVEQLVILTGIKLGLESRQGLRLDGHLGSMGDGGSSGCPPPSPGCGAGRKARITRTV